MSSCLFTESQELADEDAQKLRISRAESGTR